jgi:hypothetical protein
MAMQTKQLVPMVFVADVERSIEFYRHLYTDDVAAARASLENAGLSPSEITTPFYAPLVEFRLVDPDGYVLMITHT